MAATKRNAMLIEEAREKIRTTQLINRLQDHALGEVEMSPTQVRAVEILLKKRLPDLTHSEVTVTDQRAEAYSDDELSGYLPSRSGNGTVATARNPKVVN